VGKTAYIFSGIDALDSLKDRLFMLTLPSVKNRVANAQKVLDNVPAKFNLTEYISSSDENFKKDITLQALAVTVVQIAIFDFFISQGEKPEYLIGCSLGDVARTYCAGGVDFDTIIEASWNYHLKAQSIIGHAYHVKSKGSPLTQQMIEEIQDFGLYFAVHQTPNHFIVTGTLEKLEEWRQNEITNKHYRVYPLYDKPLHSPMMNPVTEHINNLYSHTLKPADQWKYKMVSATHLKVINTRDELLKDMTDNFNSTVYWMQVLQHSVNELGVTKLVNIGPAATLLLFAERTPFNQPVELINYFAVQNDQKDIAVAY
jgi:[acyl-carrier-protein] S-malonyltransferase